MNKRLKVFLFFFITGLMVYFNSLNNKFLMDDYYFLNNPVWSQTSFISSQFNPFREQAMGVLDTNEPPAYYRPLAHMVLDLTYSSFKNNTWKHHLLNLCLFVFVSFLVYCLIDILTGDLDLAFLSGFFYLIHPINGIIVNYISAGVFAYQVIFMLAAILLLLESLKRNNDRTLYFLSLLCSFLALFWHESGILTPFYLSVALLLFGKNSLKDKMFCLIPYFLIIFSYIFFRSVFLGARENILKQMALFHMSGGEYPAALFQVYGWYIGKLFYPQGIVFQWLTPLLHRDILLNVLGASLLAGLFIWLYVRLSKDSVCRLALIWLIIGFAPVGVAAFTMPGSGVLMEPHWFVFSSIGFFILAARFCLFVISRMKKIGLVLLFALIMTWVSFSHAYNRVWADQKTYALYWLGQDPSFKTINLYLAYAYQKEGDFKNSKKYYRMMLSGHSSDALIDINLGVMDQAQGRFKDAESEYQMALKTKPYSADVYNNLGSLYYAEGDFDQAAKFFRQSLGFNPLLTEPRAGLASIFLRRSEFQKTIDLCMKNLEIDKDDPKTLLLLIQVFGLQKDEANVQKYAYRFIDSETDPAKLTRLGVRLAGENIQQPALDCFMKAMRLAPDYKDAYLAAGTFFANLGKYEEAVRIWKIGANIDPTDQRFKDSIAKAASLEAK